MRGEAMIQQSFPGFQTNFASYEGAKNKKTANVGEDVGNLRWG